MVPKGVILYGPGRVGQLAARLIVQNGWKVVAAVNRSGSKIGADLGELCNEPRLSGIVVQEEGGFDPRSVAADIVVVTASDRVRVNLPVYRRFLAAGVNVLCVGCESSYPWAASPEIADEIDALAKSNNVTFTGSGFQDVHRVWLGMLLIGGCSNIRSFSHTSATDIGPHGLETARLVYAGLTVEQFEREVTSAVGRDTSVYRVFFEQVARSTGIAVVKVEERLEPIVSKDDLYCPAFDGKIKAGLVIGTRFRTDVKMANGVFGTARNELRLFHRGEQPRIEWSVDGDPPAQVTVAGFDSYHGTAAPLVNRIPDVLAASPGIVTIDRLGPPKYPKGRSGSNSRS